MIASRVFNRLNRRLKGKAGSNIEGRERPAGYYDSVYGRKSDYDEHYCRSRYYASWSIISDRIKSLESPSILDIGCGPGQFAALLSDQGIKSYFGLDFSQVAIEAAKRNCPGAEFRAVDVTKDHSIEQHPYNVVVCLEFLEHVESDLAVIERIPPNVVFIGSVPSFDDPAHVRTFANVKEVKERYGFLLDSFKCDEHMLSPCGNRLFLFQGATRSNTESRFER